MHTLLRQVPSHHDWFNASLGRAQHTSIRSSRHCAKPGSPIGGVGDALMESAVGLNKSVFGRPAFDRHPSSRVGTGNYLLGALVHHRQTHPSIEHQTAAFVRAMPRSRGDLGRVAGTESLQQYRDGLHRFNQN
jgi:hypothetical protein